MERQRRAVRDRLEQRVRRSDEPGHAPVHGCRVGIGESAPCLVDDAFGLNRGFRRGFVHASSLRRGAVYAPVATRQEPSKFGRILELPETLPMIVW